jgi:hypothetical protein
MSKETKDRIFYSLIACVATLGLVYTSNTIVCGILALALFMSVIHLLL